MQTGEPFAEIIESISHALTIHELSSVFEAAGKAAGFTHFTILQPAMSGTAASGLILTNYPGDWIKQSVKTTIISTVRSSAWHPKERCRSSGPSFPNA